MATLIERHVYNQLGGDADKVNPDIIDRSLTYNEKKVELAQYIIPLQSTEQRHASMIKGVSEKAIEQQNNAYEHQSHRLMMRGFWTCMRRKNKRLKRKINSPHADLREGAPPTESVIG